MLRDRQAPSGDPVVWGPRWLRRGLPAAPVGVVLGSVFVAGAGRRARVMNHGNDA